MKLSIVLSTEQADFQAATFKGDISENMAFIASLGYQGVELAIRNPRLVDREELLKIVSVHNLEVPAIGTGQAWGEEGLSFTDPDESGRRAAVQRIKDHIPLASSLNAVIIIGLIRGIVKPGVSQSQAETWLLEALQECAQAAGRQAVRLALEPINRYETSLINTVTQGIKLIKDVGADNFGLLLDTFHMNIEEPNIEESIRLCGDEIYHIHAADSNRRAPGYGHLNFKAILNSLNSSGFQGYVSGEFLPLPDEQSSARQNIQHLSQILAEIDD